MSSGELPGVDPAPTQPSIGAEDLAAAVAAGVLPAATAEALARFAATRHGGAVSPRDGSADEESIRFVTSFNDIFVTIGIFLLVGAEILLVDEHSTLVAAALTAAVIWALAEIFSRRWHMALPSIVLTGGFVAAAGVFGATAAQALGSGDDLSWIAGGLAAVIFGGLHWWRFGVPISVAATVAGGGVILFALVNAISPAFIERHLSPLLLAMGLAAFALAMWWDASDRERRTRRTDVAFWLHILAAPAIVHPLISSTGLEIGHIRPDAAPIILAFFAALAFVALVVDRRALLVSGLLYLGVTMGTLIERLGWAASSSGSLAAGVVGAVVLGLAVGWTPLRGLALRLVPASIRAWVPTPRIFHGRMP